MSEKRRIELHEIFEERGAFKRSFGHSFGGVLGTGLGVIVISAILGFLLIGAIVVVVVLATSASRQNRPSAKTPDSSAGAITTESRKKTDSAVADASDKPKPAPPKILNGTARANQLAASLIDATPAKREELTATYRDAKGSEYTEALAAAAARLNDEPQEKVRAALVARLSRMTATTLNEYLRDLHLEIRKAAARACASKKDTLVVPELVRALAEDDTALVQSARESLKSITGEDHGPEIGASPSERLKCVLAWRKWLENQPKASGPAG